MDPILFNPKEEPEHTFNPSDVIQVFNLGLALLAFPI
jgi:hypothetical protein